MRGLKLGMLGGNLRTEVLRRRRSSLHDLRRKEIRLHGTVSLPPSTGVQLQRRGRERRLFGGCQRGENVCFSFFCPLISCFEWSLPGLELPLLGDQLVPVLHEERDGQLWGLEDQAEAKVGRHRQRGGEGAAPDSGQSRRRSSHHHKAIFPFR